MLDLDYGLYCGFERKRLDVTLAHTLAEYFNPSYDTSKKFTRFISKDFTLSKILKTKT